MNRWIRRVVYLVIIGLVWVVVSEIARYQARAALEEEMRANFEVLQCPQDQIEGDVCLAYPDEGRCLTGAYIDYRTVWGRIVGEREIRKELVYHYERLGSLQAMANWLACQGFSQPRIYYSEAPPRATNYAEGLTLSFFAVYKYGHSVWLSERWMFPFAPVLGPTDNAVGIVISETNEIKAVSISSNRALY